MKPLEQCLLYTFIDSAYLRGRDPAELAQQLCDGGSDLIQIRAKDLSTEAVRQMSEAVAPIVARAGVNLVINDYPEIAAEVGAPFCHLGQEDFFNAGYATVDQIPNRSLSGGLASVRMGLSSHAPDQAQRAVKAGASYVAVGPIYATLTKPGAPAVSLDYVRWASRNLTIPWFAIGGIDLDRIDAVLEAGARRICVVSAILNAANVTQACQAFKERLFSAGRI